MQAALDAAIAATEVPLFKAPPGAPPITSELVRDGLSDDGDDGDDDGA